MYIVVIVVEQEQKMENLKYVQNVREEELWCKTFKWDSCKCKCKLIATNVEEKGRQWQLSALTVMANV